MLDFIASHQFTLIGVIFMLVIGPAIGNYACSVVYRLPRGKTPFERHPYCGHCNADLKPIDLFPILSWFSTRGKCRYCAGAIPGIYTVIELVCGAVFIAYFLAFGMGELFLLYAAYAVFVIITAAIQWQQGWIAATIYSYAIACIMLIRTFSESTIHGVIQSGFVMLILAIIAERLLRKHEFKPFERPWVWWMVLLGALVPIAEWKLVLPVYLAALLVPKEARLLVYATGALALPLAL